VKGERFFKHEDYEFLFLLTLGAAYRGGADLGECLVTASRVKDGDPESWYAEWKATADRTAEAASASEEAGHQISARAAWLRAATYYDTASFFLDSTKDPDRLLPTWELHRAAWDRVAALLGFEPVEIPYEGTTLPGYLKPAGARGERRPLLVMNNGSDGPASAMWLQGGAAGAERGYGVLIFDGPGQGAALFRQQLYFRPDWEKVLTPVVDFALERPETDPERIVVVGVSQAGYWVPRALAFEARFAAGVADPGVWDVATSWLDHVPGSMQKLLDKGDRDKFNRNMDFGLRFSRSARGTIAFRMRPYGLDMPYDVFEALRAYNLDGVAERITVPLLVTDPDGEQFWPGQSRQLHDALTGPKRLVRFTAEEGADWHCEPKALALREQRIFDWLDETLGGAVPAPAPAP
jgi:hypothetical protein